MKDSTNMYKNIVNDKENEYKELVRNLKTILYSNNYWNKVKSECRICIKMKWMEEMNKLIY